MLNISENRSISTDISVLFQEDPHLNQHGVKSSRTCGTEIAGSLKDTGAYFSCTSLSTPCFSPRLLFVDLKLMSDCGIAHLFCFTVETITLHN